MRIWESIHSPNNFAEFVIEFQEKLASDLYEHIRDAKSHYDAQMSDAATESQQQQQEMMDVDKDDACDDDQLPLDADEEAEKEEASLMNSLWLIQYSLWLIQYCMTLLGWPCHTKVKCILV